MADSRPDLRPEADIAMATQAHQLLVTTLDRAIADGTLDVGAPSALPDWSKGHVITHVINSGDGHSGIFGAAAVGEVRAQYPHGIEGRAADIEAGAARPAAEQLEALRQSNTTLEACWESTSWEGVGITPRGDEIAITELPFYRAREATIHLVDLDIGIGFDDLPEHYVAEETGRMTAQWSAKQPEGVSELPGRALELAPPERLAWLMGRSTVSGLAPANVF